MTQAGRNSTELSEAAPLHMIDIIRRKRDGGKLDAREIAFVAAGAASGSIPEAELAAWLMASWIRGLSLSETRALTLAMRDSGEKFSTAGLGRRTVDKHSSGGVGDKTSFLVAPLAAACGVAVPMISGRAPFAPAAIITPARAASAEPIMKVAEITKLGLTPIRLATPGF